MPSYFVILCQKTHGTVLKVIKVILHLLLFKCLKGSSNGVRITKTNVAYTLAVQYFKRAKEVLLYHFLKGNEHDPAQFGCLRLNVDVLQHVNH